MNVLIVATNRHKAPAPVLPFGACLVAEAAERAGHRVRLLDLMWVRDPQAALAAALAAAPADVVGFSVRNLDNHDMRNPRMFFDDLLPLVRTARLMSGAVLLAGGSAVGIMPEEFLRRSGLSLGVAGNGEFVFPELLDALSAGRDPAGIPGVVTLKGSVFTAGRPDTARFSRECAVPDFSRWLDARPYRTAMTCAPVQSKRGCPFSCVYCTYPITEGPSYRLCEPESVARAVRRLARSGFRDIEFVDNVFNSPYEHALEVCEALARCGHGARLHTLELNPAFVDDRLLDAMERAGFAGIGITAESASDAVLAGLGKSYGSAALSRASAAVARHRLPCMWIFLLGGPGETRETVLETLRFAEHGVRRNDAAFFNVGIRLYPGTPLEKTARAEGVIEGDVSSMFLPVSYVSPSLDAAWLHGSVRAHMKRCYHFATSDTLGLPLLPLLNRVGGLAGMHPPFWRHTARLRRVLRTIGANV